MEGRYQLTAKHENGESDKAATQSKITRTKLHSNDSNMAKAIVRWSTADVDNLN